MNTLDDAGTSDTLGRSTAPRRYRTIEEKRRIVEETLVRGASVAVVARRHEVNANLVFGWRKLYQRGLLGEPKGQVSSLLPVQVREDAPSERQRMRRTTTRSSGVPPESRIEIELAGGGRLCVHGEAARELLRELVERLCHR